MVKILLGNLFDTKAKTLVNTVNCVGVMGKGIALEFKKRYPAMFEQYAELCKKGQIKPGIPYYYQDLFGNSILLFPTKDHWRSPSRLSYIEDGLDWFTEHYEDLGITSIAFPPLGCGNGGLDWQDVGSKMISKLHDLPIDIEIYAPYGTNESYLDPEKLFSMADRKPMKKIGSYYGSINQEWLPILYIIQQLKQNPYALHVGRVNFQKICYAVTREGFRTNFEFSRNIYGPYSSGVIVAEKLFYNNNLIRERKLGENMVEIIVSPDFRFDLSTRSEEERNKIAKIIDLFSRFRNTEETEFAMTVLFVYDELAIKGSIPRDVDIYNAVLEWKPRWQNKRYQIIEAIQCLTELEWIQCEFTPEYIEEDFFALV